LSVIAISPLWGEESKTTTEHLADGMFYTAEAIAAMSAAGFCAESGNLALAGTSVIISAGAASRALKEFQAIYSDCQRETNQDINQTGSEGTACDKDSSLR
jgi:hypothetical protein